MRLRIISGMYLMKTHSGYRLLKCNLMWYDYVFKKVRWPIWHLKNLFKKKTKIKQWDPCIRLDRNKMNRNVAWALICSTRTRRETKTFLSNPTDRQADGRTFQRILGISGPGNFFRQTSPGKLGPSKSGPGKLGPWKFLFQQIGPKNYVVQQIYNTD